MRYQIRAQIEEDFNNNFNILLTTSEIYALFGSHGSLAKFPEHNYQRRDWIHISSECRIYRSELVAPFFFKRLF
jgi:arginine/lysine/ornithine decarboxylase